MNKLEFVEYADAINRLLAIGVIKKCKPCAGQFLSKYFLTQRANSSTRFIFNAKKLNEFITPVHFKMEDIRTAIKLVSPDAFMGSLDLRDAYHLISIHREYKKYLRFSWNNELYEYTCLPFGLCTASWLFTKITKPILNFLRSQGYVLVVYLDNWLLLGLNYNLCLTNIQKTKNTLERLGFVVNYEKSHLVPNKTCKFLGFVINSRTICLELPQNHKEKILDKLSNLKSKKQCAIREFAQLVGMLTAACPAVKYWWLHTKPFERERYLALLNNNENYN